MPHRTPPLLIEPPSSHRDAPVALAFSGGMDSSVLLHLLHARAQVDGGPPLRALHVDHGLHAQSAAWAAHCAEVCAGLGVELRVLRVTVDRSQGLGPEGAARQARHAALSDALQPGEVLAVAQHQDDQAETFLLRALRGSGTDGLAAMRPWRAFGRGWLWRPLLHHPRANLAARAQALGLRWVEDPSNADATLDRNYLRIHVLPALRARWPQADAAFARAAALAAESSEMLMQEDARILFAVRNEVGGSLSVSALRALTPGRRARALRYWATSRGAPPLPGEGIAQIEQDLLAATEDRQPAFAWGGAEIRRWRDALYLLDTDRALPAEWSTRWNGDAPLLLPNGDRLELRGASAFPAPVIAHPRRGGERILLPDREHHHQLKHVLQDEDIPPWERARMPLLSAEDGTLLAAGERVRSAVFDAWLQAYGADLLWVKAEEAGAV
jgi:tRNA(Ile)-lysidine synthase